MTNAGSDDPWGVVLPLLGIAAVGAILAHKRWQMLVAMRAGLTLAGAPDASIAGLATVIGTLQGRPVRYLCDARNTRPADGTVVTTFGPPGSVEIELHLTPQTGSTRDLVERGLAVDVEVGEPLFDEAFVVEAAPADTARALLDAPTRAGLMALRPCELHVVNGEVTFRRLTRLNETAQVASLAGLVARVAARLGTLAPELEEKKLRTLTDDGAGYRGVSAPEAAAKLGIAAASDELANLHDVQERRRAQRRNLLLVGALIVFVVVLLVVLTTYQPFD